METNIKVLTEDEVKQYDHLKKKHTVYLITNLINFKIYVGVHSTYNVFDGYMGSGKVIRMAIKKYGIENFKKEIIAIFDNRKDALKLEKEIVNNNFLNSDNTYNLTMGGAGIKLDSWSCNKGKKLSPETCQKMSIARKGNKNSLGVKRSDGWKERQSKRLMGHNVSPETRKKISSAQKGKPRWTEEEKQNLSIMRKGSVHLTNKETGEDKRAKRGSELYNKLLSEGFVEGRNYKHNSETLIKMGIKRKGQVWLTNKETGEQRMVMPDSDEFKLLIESGFERGRGAFYKEKILKETSNGKLLCAQ